MDWMLDYDYTDVAEWMRPISMHVYKITRLHRVFCLHLQKAWEGKRLESKLFAFCRINRWTFWTLIITSREVPTFFIDTTSVFLKLYCLPQINNLNQYTHLVLQGFTITRSIGFSSAWFQFSILVSWQNYSCHPTQASSSTYSGVKTITNRRERVIIILYLYTPE